MAEVDFYLDYETGAGKGSWGPALAAGSRKLRVVSGVLNLDVPATSQGYDLSSIVKLFPKEMMGMVVQDDGQYWYDVDLGYPRLYPVVREKRVGANVDLDSVPAGGTITHTLTLPDLVKAPGAIWVEPSSGVPDGLIVGQARISNSATSEVKFKVFNITGAPIDAGSGFWFFTMNNVYDYTNTPGMYPPFMAWGF